MSTVEDFAAAQAVEYGTYKAAVAIYHDGVLAYNAGDSVPVSNVEAHGYLDDGLVVGADEPLPDAPTTTPAPLVGEPVVVDTPQED